MGLLARHLCVGWCAAAAVLWACAAGAGDIQDGAVLVADDFERFDKTVMDIGASSTGAKRWAKRVGMKDGVPFDLLVRGMKGALWIGYSSGYRPHDCGVYVDGFAVADAVVGLTVGPSTMKGRALTAAISYRATTPDAAGGGWQPGAYHVEVGHDWSGSRDIVLRHGRERLAAGDVAGRRLPTDTHRIKVAFHGDHHQVWVGERKVIDYWETAPGRRSAGQVGFGTFYSQGTFDDFEVRAVASGPTAPTFDTRDGRIAPLVYQGRPFFVLGTFDAPREEDLAQWKESGGNTAIVGAMSETLSADQRRDHLAGLAAWAAEHGIAMVYHPTFQMYSKDGKRTIPTRPAEIPAKVKLFNEMLAVTASHAQTLGYWTFDEIENHLYKAYGDWDKKKDKGLAQWIADSMKWTYETLKAGDPDAYVMPTIAWWTTYQGLAPLYDVNVPNTYAAAEKHAPLEGPLYNMSYDAVKAADAIRVTGRTSFVFMPGIFDILYKGAPLTHAPRAALRLLRTAHTWGHGPVAVAPGTLHARLPPGRGLPDHARGRPAGAVARGRVARREGDEHTRHGHGPVLEGVPRARAPRAGRGSSQEDDRARPPRARLLSRPAPAPGQHLPAPGRQQPQRAHRRHVHAPGHPRAARPGQRDDRLAFRPDHRRQDHRHPRALRRARLRHRASMTNGLGLLHTDALGAAKGLAVHGTVEQCLDLLEFSARARAHH